MVTTPEIIREISKRLKNHLGIIGACNLSQVPDQYIEDAGHTSVTAYNELFDLHDWITNPKRRERDNNA